jgi:hypothetical protein
MEFRPKSGCFASPLDGAGNRISRGLSQQARGAPSPLALFLDFARRSSRRRYGAGEQFFRALRPGLRREYPPLKLTTDRRRRP